MNLRRMRPPPLPPEMSDADKIAALESEQRLLRPFASTDGLRKLRARLREIDDALDRLRGLPLDDAP